MKLNEYTNNNIKKHYLVINLSANKRFIVEPNISQTNLLNKGKVMSMMDGVSSGSTLSYINSEIEFDFGMIESRIMREYFNKYLTSEEYQNALERMKIDLPEYFV